MMNFSYSKAIAHVVENFPNRNEMVYRFNQDSGVFWFRLNSDSMPLFNTFCCYLDCSDRLPRQKAGRL